MPCINGREIDLYLLYWLVTAQGGWERVSEACSDDMDSEAGVEEMVGRLVMRGRGSEAGHVVCGAAACQTGSRVVPRFGTTLLQLGRNSDLPLL